MNSEKVISNIKKAIKEHLDNNYAYDMLVDFELDVIDWNSLFEYIDKLQQENKQLKDNWEIIRQYCLDEQIPEESDEYNSYIEFSNSVYDNILNKMQELQGSDGNGNN